MRRPRPDDEEEELSVDENGSIRSYGSKRARLDLQSDTDEEEVSHGNAAYSENCADRFVVR